MSNVWAILRRELSAYFNSPIAYVVLALFIFLFGAFFYTYLLNFIQFGLQMSQSPYGAARTMNLNQDLIRWLLGTTNLLIVFMLPLITMRTLAEEKRSGTIELLLTSPVTDFEIVLGKFLAAVTLYGAMLGLTFIHMSFLFLYGDPEWKPLVAGYLGLLLMGGAFISLGVLFSSLTKNQIVAAFLSFGVFLFLYIIEVAEVWAGPYWGSIISYLSVTKHTEDFAKGVIDTKDVVYYLSFIGFGLFLSKQSVESHRWRG